MLLDFSNRNLGEGQEKIESTLVRPHLQLWVQNTVTTFKKPIKEVKHRDGDLSDERCVHQGLWATEETRAAWLGDERTQNNHIPAPEGKGILQRMHPEHLSEPCRYTDASVCSTPTESKPPTMPLHPGICWAQSSLDHPYAKLVLRTSSADLFCVSHWKSQDQCVEIIGTFTWALKKERERENKESW